MAVSSSPSSRPLVSTSQSGSTPEIRRGLAHRRLVVGIGGDGQRRQGADGREHARRAAGGVLVQVQAQARTEVGHALDGGHRVSAFRAAGRRVAGVVRDLGVVRRARAGVADEPAMRISIERAWPFQALGPRQRRDRACQAGQAGLRERLDRHELDEVRGVEAAADPGRAGGGQHVVRADGVIAGDLRRPRADEHRAGIGDTAARAHRCRRPDARAPPRWPALSASAIVRVTMMPP